MLVLSRKVGERIVIDGQIVLTVLDVRGGRMKLGIQAPGDVPIHRQEVYDQLPSWQNGQAPAFEAQV